MPRRVLATFTKSAQSCIDPKVLKTCDQAIALATSSLKCLHYFAQPHFPQTGMCMPLHISPARRAGLRNNAMVHVCAGIHRWGMGPEVLTHRMITDSVGAKPGGLKDAQKALYKEYSAINHVDANDPPVYLTVRTAPWAMCCVCCVCCVCSVCSVFTIHAGVCCSCVCVGGVCVIFVFCANGAENRIAAQVDGDETIPCVTNCIHHAVFGMHLKTAADAAGAVVYLEHQVPKLKHRTMVVELGLTHVHLTI